MDVCYLLNPFKLCADNLGQDALGKEIFNLSLLSFLAK